MTGPEFQAALTEAGYTQAGFARFMAEHGYQSNDLPRTVRAWTKRGPPESVVVVLNLVAGQGIAPPLGYAWKLVELNRREGA